MLERLADSNSGKFFLYELRQRGGKLCKTCSRGRIKRSGKDRNAIFARPVHQIFINPETSGNHQQPDATLDGRLLDGASVTGHDQQRRGIKSLYTR